MEMPRRPFFPPVALPPDIFGLPHLSLLGRACETEAERLKRRSIVEAGVVAAFKAAIDHLGEEQARLLFARVVRRPKRGPGKALAADRDARLLREYDNRNGESIAALARRLRRISGAALGNTEGAIATQIRKLVKERKARNRAAAIEERRWRMATRGEGSSILSAAMNEK